jgi:hypothetical protein
MGKEWQVYPLILPDVSAWVERQNEILMKLMRSEPLTDAERAYLNSLPDEEEDY